MPKFRRLIVPIAMVLGAMICAYASFFVGVKDDLPSPPGSTRQVLPAVKQADLITQWPESRYLKSALAEVIVTRDPLEQTAAYYRDAFVNKRKWAETSPTPDQPRDAQSGQTFRILSFSKDKNLVIIAIGTGAQIQSGTGKLYEATKFDKLRADDIIAVVVSGQK